MNLSKYSFKAMGPGLLFAAVSVGVSHLVQSTRAGAGYGFALVWVILLALILKYPLFEFGQRYAVATGSTLLEGYRRQGKWSLVLYLILTLATMFAVLAAVTAVTAGMAIQLTGWKPSISILSPVELWSLMLIIIGLLILGIGRFPLMDKIVKGVMVVLAVSTVVAVISLVPHLYGICLWGKMGLMDIGFIVALVGWMPTGMDVSVWQSLWTLAREQETGHTPSLDETLFDFKVGYMGTAILALMFCFLGTAVMFDKGITVEDSAGAFAGQIIELYTSALGSWSRPIIVVSAFTTMLSTMLTVSDGFPRALQMVGRRFRTAEEKHEVLQVSGNSWDYWLWLAILAGGAMLIIVFYLESLAGLVDLATTLSFLSAPFLGLLTYRAVTASWVAPEFRPGRWLQLLAIISIAFLTVFSFVFLYFRFF